MFKTSMNKKQKNVDLSIEAVSRLSLNEAKAQIRNRFELTRLELRMQEIEKQRAISACTINKHSNSLKQVMHDVRSSTGKSEYFKPTKKVKKAPTKKHHKRKVSDSLNDSSTTIDFTEDFINKQNEESLEMLYSVFNINDPQSKYNPAFLRVKHLAKQTRSSDSSTCTSDTDDESSSTSSVDKWSKPIVTRAKPKVYNIHERKLSIGDDQLRRTYHAVCDERDCIPPRNIQRIETLKTKDPIFSKRYKHFTTATNAGKPPFFDPNDTNIRIILSKSSLEKYRTDTRELFKVKHIERENPYLKCQKKLNEKVAQFLKSLPTS